MALTDEQIAKVATDHGFEVLERISTQLRATGQADVAGRVDFVSALFRSALSAQPAPCGEYVAVRADAVEWLKNHYPALCEKSGMCERVAGRLYTRTTLSAQLAKPAITEARVIELAKKAGFCFIHDGYGKPYDDVIQKFATLIAAEGKVK